MLALPSGPPCPHPPRQSLLTTLLQAFGNPDAEVRLHILKILTSIVAALGARGASLASLRPFIDGISRRDPAILVR